MNQDLCDKLWGARDLAGKIISSGATHVLWHVVHELHDIEEKTGLRWYLQLLNELFLYFFKYLCGQFRESVQSVYPETDYIHYTVIAVTVGLCRTFEVCVEFAQKQRVFAQSVPPWCQLRWRTREFVQKQRVFAQSVPLWCNPCGGGIEYLHRDPASRKRRRNGAKKGRALA
jgi:hypothetical protein